MKANCTVKALLLNVQQLIWTVLTPMLPYD